MTSPGNRTSAGFPSPADDYLEKALDLNELLITNRVATFYMRVDGDDLAASGIRNGDLLIVDRSIKATEGKTVVAIVDGELVLRRLEKRDGKTLLVSDNVAVAPARYDGDEVQIWGVATSVVHPL